MADFLVTVAGFINGYDPTVDGLRASPSNHGSFTCSCWPCAAGGQGAVFAVQDVLLFFLAWELELIPVYLLLAMGFQRDGDPPGFAYGDIAAKPLGPAFQVLCYSGLLVAFGVKLPVVPVHTPGCRQSVQSIILNVRPCGSFTDQVPSCWGPSNSSIRRVEVRA